MKENFKLRKMKVGLVSIAMAAMYITMQGQAEASEHAAEVPQQKSIQNIEKKQIDPTEAVNEKQTDPKENVHANYVKLDKVTPGDTKITGKTLPHQPVLLNIDGKSSGSVEDGDSGFTESDESGLFKFDLKDRKIVFNQKIDVSSSNFDIESEESSEEEGAEATDTTTTGRYDKAYEIPTKQFSKQNGHHQIFVEPILKDSGIIKGHTSVKGRVALAINNKFVNLSDSSEYEKAMSNADAKSRVDVIWKHIDDKGYFEFDFKRKPLENFNLKNNDLVSIAFKPNNEEEALIPLIFNVRVTNFDNINNAVTSYSPEKVKKVATINTITDDLQIDDIKGFDYVSDRGIDVPTKNGQGTKVIEGKTKFANAVVNVTSSLGEGNEFPDLQVDKDGKFSFNASDAGFRLNNGEKLHFVVVDPLSGKVLSKLVTKEIKVAETEAQRKEREFDELIEVTPAYFKLAGNEIRGYDIHGYILTYFNAYDKKELERHIYKG
ncbi:hypothetical protein KJB58_07325 [Staphylococcus hyicus]|uniref:hypothetical protein n=1 Tax=Staphylococcus hyicus TaxID=1284 RepID=UPI001F45FC7F|nr:hypothetical protein [Staphylococcus hyicus]MCE5154275.1 hypothetical protein [Staphylococcus hyicus]